MTAADPPPTDEIDPRFVALVERYSAAMDEGRIADADAASNEIMAFVVEQEQSKGPSPEVLRSLMAEQAENDGEWNVARQIYEEELAEALRQSVPLAKFAQASRWKRKLAYVEYKQEQLLAAFELARDSVELARQVDSEVVLAMAVESFAGFAIRAGRLQDAMTAIDQALAAASDRLSFAHIRAQLLTRRAEVALAMGDHGAARASLASARQSIAPLASSPAAGIRATLASGLEQEAKLTMHAGDWPAARAAWEEAVELRRQLAEHWDHSRRTTDCLAETIAEFAAAANAAGDTHLAESLRAAK